MVDSDRDSAASPLPTRTAGSKRQLSDRTPPRAARETRTPDGFPSDHEWPTEDCVVDEDEDDAYAAEDLDCDDDSLEDDDGFGNPLTSNAAIDRMTATWNAVICSLTDGTNGFDAAMYLVGSVPEDERGLAWCILSTVFDDNAHSFAHLTPPEGAAAAVPAACAGGRDGGSAC